MKVPPDTPRHGRSRRDGTWHYEGPLKSCGTQSVRRDISCSASDATPTPAAPLHSRERRGSLTDHAAHSLPHTAMTRRRTSLVHVVQARGRQRSRTMVDSVQDPERRTKLDGTTAKQAWSQAEGDERARRPSQHSRAAASTASTTGYTCVIEREELALVCFTHDIVKNPGRVDRPRSAEPHSSLARAMTSHARIEQRGAPRPCAHEHMHEMALINRAHALRGTRHSREKSLESSIS